MFPCLPVRVCTAIPLVSVVLTPGTKTKAPSGYQVWHLSAGFVAVVSAYVLLVQLGPPPWSCTTPLSFQQPKMVAENRFLSGFARNQDWRVIGPETG